ncbi:nuclease-related domain-containing protein [Brevundimonas faecalis]|uniref:nuclease-related domain-containing protein n=1 Tax=Brevundimonas faecalis TaxID=947378 RepID=UPI00360B31E7
MADAFPSTWLMYASLTCYPPRQHSFELDVVVVTHDRVLILELKELSGSIQSSGDMWQLGKKRRFRSPVAVTAEKARKVKGLLLQQIRPLAGVSVDHRIVLVGPADFTALPDDQKDYCWTLAQACSIAQRFNYNQLLPAARLLHVKPCMLELDFDRVLGDPKLFSVREQTWDGYATDEENTFVHPRGVWTEHRAQRQRDGRLKALLRLWNFSKLPAGLNVPDARRSVADREAQVIAHLQDADSWLVQRGAVLNPIASHQDEVLTQHFELFSLDTHTTSLRRFLERHHEALSPEQRLDLATALIVAVAELHRQFASCGGIYFA